MRHTIGAIAISAVLSLGALSSAWCDGSGHRIPAFGSQHITTNDGVWSVAPTFHDRNAPATLVYDSAQDRLILFGGLGQEISYLNDVWVYSLSERIWSRLATSETPPAGRWGSAAIYDPIRNRVIIFGGSTPALSNEVWQLTLSGTPTWGQLAPSGTPPTPRSSPSAIYDALRDRMVVFAGNDGTARNDVFALSLAGAPSWSLLPAAGTPPLGRSFAAAIYDPIRDRLVTYGGGGDSISTQTETWALSFPGNTWTRIITPTSPPPQIGPGAYDPFRDRMLIYSYGGELWALDFSGVVDWHDADTSPSPGERYYHTLALDPGGDRVILFGGVPLASSDTWEIPLTAPVWTKQGDGEPPAEKSGVWSTIDSRRERMVVMLRNFSGTPAPILLSLKLDTHQWIPLIASGTPPPADLTGSSVIYDRAGDRIVLFGGNSGSGLVNRTWALQLSGSPDWVELFPTGVPPTPRERGAAVLDTLGDRMIVFGGNSAAGGTNDVWALRLSGSPEWSPILPGGSPPPPHGAPWAIYDESGHRMIFCAGGPVYFLTLGATPEWSSAPGNGVTYRTFRPFYDGARHRMIGFEYAQLYELARYWAFDLESLQWSELHPVSAAPASAKDNAPMALQFDRRRHRVVHFGLNSYTGLGHHSAANGTWLWSFGSPAVSVPDAAALDLSGWVSVGPTPGRGVQTFAFRIAPGDEARALEIFTVDGRRVWRAPLGGRGPGLHSLAWDGRVTNGTRVPAAVYFARLMTSRTASIRRFVRL